MRPKGGQCNVVYDTSGNRNYRFELVGTQVHLFEGGYEVLSIKGKGVYSSNRNISSF